MMQQCDDSYAAAAEGDERKMHAADSSSSPSAAAAAATAREGDSAYRQVERQFKLAPAGAAAAGKQKQGAHASKRARKAAAAATASASAVYSPSADAIPASQRYAAEFARWQADTIDLHDLDNNTAANRLRIVRHEMHLPRVDSEQQNAANAHTAAASSVPIASASSSSSAAAVPAPSSWISPSAQLFSLSDTPGFFVLRGALDLNAQSWWAWHSLRHYSRVAYTNLSNLEARRATTSKPAADAAAAAKASMDDAYAAAASPAASPSSSSSASAAAASAPSPSPSPSADLWTNYCRTSDERPLRALRWSCLGYAYDWSAREYSPAMREAFPPELGALSAELAKACGFPSLLAEAAIVNYYPASASMGGHIDDAELTKLHPIVSVSLGCTAVFLLGGPEKTQRPQAFLLRSGDVAIMGGEARVCYHGVPRILEGSFGDEQLMHTMQQRQREQQTEQQQQQQMQMHDPSASAASESSQEECKESNSGRIVRSASPAEEGCSKKQKSTAAGAAIDRSRSALQQPQQAWSPERCYDRLRFDSTDAPIFPSAAVASGLALPTREELLHVYRFLRRSRLNLNVRQVEDETFTYAKGLSSARCREMKLQQQKDMAAAAREHGAEANSEPHAAVAAASMQS